MEEEGAKGSLSRAIETEQQLKRLIVATYRGRTQADTTHAQVVLNQSLNTPGFIDKLVSLISNPHSSEIEIKMGAAGQIKNFAYDFARKEGDKSSFIELLFNLIMQETLETKVKQMLGGALEHLFIQDEKAVYKDIVKEKVVEALLREDGISRFDSCLVVFQAHFNSLLAEPDQLVDFLLEILQPLSAAALQIHELIAKMNFEEWLIRDKFILPKVTLLFDFLEDAFEKLTDSAESLEDLEEDLKLIRGNTFFVALIESYLLLFHNNHSIVSHVYPTINLLKKSVMSVVWMLYRSGLCPEKIFQIIFLTALMECREIVNDLDVQQILVNCLNVLQTHLASKHYLQLFQYHKMEFVFALFMYSVTNEEEYQLIDEDPQAFSDIAESYCEGSKQNTYLKVRAAAALRVFAEKIDEAPRNILEIIMVIMSGSIGTQDQDSELMQCVKAEFSRFNFYGLSNEQKLQASFMILAALAKQINRREDMNKVVYAFFLTQFEALVRIESPIVILRIVRAIGYYPSALYFLFIETQMNRGKIFIIEGIKALERILRTNKFAELFQFLSSIFIKLMGVVRIEDPVMELIVMNYYQEMLKVNSELYRVCRNKIKESFFLNVATNQHATCICFNLLYSLLKKEKDTSVIPLIEADYYEISSFLEAEEQLELYYRYEEKLIEIYQLIVEKSYNIKPQVERFALRSIRYLARQERGTQIFRFYNIYLVKLDGAIFKLDSYFRAFWEEVKRRFQVYEQTHESLEVIAYYCFLMSEILANHCQILLKEEDLKSLMQMAEKLPKQQKQYPIIVLLTHLYMQPYPTVNFFKKYNIYEQFLQGITKIYLEGTIIKKIYNLAFIMLLEIEENPLFIKQILIQCIHNLKELNRKTRKRLERTQVVEVKARKLGEERVPQDMRQEQMQPEEKNDNELVNLFVKFKHPFESLSEFDQFKVKFWMNDHLIGDLNPQIKADLRSIMQTELVDNSKVRIIKKVKR